MGERLNCRGHERNPRNERGGPTRHQFNTSRSPESCLLDHLHVPIRKFASRKTEDLARLARKLLNPRLRISDLHLSQRVRHSVKNNVIESVSSQFERAPQRTNLALVKPAVLMVL